ncbi:MAG TPA: alkaline phosphatase family protein [Terriglobia bacterium]|nr:alkaline phosphatase family protein [Terriglobia bacterium]
MARTSLVVLIDALGWSYLKDRDFMPDILGFRTEVRTVLGFSCGAIPTLLSGLTPAQSGHWNLFYYSPERSPFRWVRLLSPLPNRLLNNRVVRRGVRFISQRLSQFGGYFQIYGVPTELLPYFDICEKEDIYKPGGVPGSIFDQLKEAGIPYRSYSYHEFSDEGILREASRDLKDRKYDFYFVYLSELDAFLHDWCGDKQRVGKEIDRYSRWLRELYATATQTSGEVDFFVLSDHGMTPKRAGFDLIKEIASLELTVPRDYIGLYDSTMARFWFFNPAAEARIAQRLNALSCGHILDANEKRRFGIDFGDNRFGDAVFLMKPGVVIEPSFWGRLGPAGMHGFDPEADPDASAIFFANHDPGQPVRSLHDVNSVLVEWINSRAAVRTA